MSLLTMGRIDSYCFLRYGPIELSRLNALATEIAWLRQKTDLSPGPDSGSNPLGIIFSSNQNLDSAALHSHFPYSGLSTSCKDCCIHHIPLVLNSHPMRISSLPAFCIQLGPDHPGRTLWQSGTVLHHDRCIEHRNGCSCALFADANDLEASNADG
jgi:hypothetical protein